MRMTEEEYATFQTRRQIHAQNRQVGTQSIQSAETDSDKGQVQIGPEMPIMGESENDQPESKLQQRIEKELRRRGYLFFHDRSRGMNAPGLPDLLIWAPGGRHILMELKRKGGTMSDEQKRFASRALWLGQEWHEVRSFRQAVGILDKCSLCGRLGGEGSEEIPCPVCGIGEA